MAEVLVTLGIIGIIAALTLPSLIAKQQKKITVTQLQKTYSMFNQAIRLSEADNGEYSTWDLPKNGWHGESNKKFFEKYFKPYLKFSRYCGTDINKNCSHIYDNHNAVIKFVLNNGVSAAATYSSTSMAYWIDINGLKGPNKDGIDRFMFESRDIFRPYVWTDKTDPYSAKTRESYLEGCEYSHITCAGLIMYDGWDIKEDYPLRF